jgi:hypothetical protein
VNSTYAQQAFLKAVYDADLDHAIVALNKGVDVNTADPLTGLSALHIAIGTNNLSLTRTLIEEFDAAIKPDGRGRLPSVIAAECRVDDRLSEYVAKVEAKALAPV